MVRREVVPFAILNSIKIFLYPNLLGGSNSQEWTNLFRQPKSNCCTQTPPDTENSEALTQLNLSQNVKVLETNTFRSFKNFSFTLAQQKFYSCLSGFAHVFCIAYLDLSRKLLLYLMALFTSVITTCSELSTLHAQFLTLQSASLTVAILGLNRLSAAGASHCYLQSRLAGLAQPGCVTLIQLSGQTVNV